MKRAALLAVMLSLLTAATAVRAQPYRFEAESGILGGTSIQYSTPGYSGSGYVNFNSGDYVQVQASVPDGLYELWIGYNSPFGFKGYEYEVDQMGGSGGFDGNGSLFGVDRAGVFNLTGDSHTLRINRGWGWYNVDYFELQPFTPPVLLPVSSQLSDPLADRHTQQLMDYMVSQYGSKTLSGHQGQVGGNGPFPTQDYLNKSGGLVPAIRGSDFIDYSPSRLAHGSNPNGETERVIDWAKGTGGIVTMMWHWNAPTDLVDAGEWPWWRGFYTNGTTFDLPGALANPSGSDHQLILRDIDTIAAELQKFEDAGVPVIWRPLHEAQGGWFWWGAHGPDTFKGLWNLLYDRLTNEHGLHNLIWEFTSSASEANHLDWYPGDDLVDVVGLDIYTDPSSSMSGPWYDVLDEYNGRKMIALSETGTLPSADLMDTYGIVWSYFSPWTWDFVRDQYAQAGYTDAQLTALLQDLMGDEDVITLEELPILPWSHLAPALPGDYNADGVVDAADYTVWRDSMGQTGSGLAADGNGNGEIDAGDYAVWKLYFGQTIAGGVGSITSASVPEPAGGVLLLCGLISAGLLQRQRRLNRTADQK